MACSCLGNTRARGEAARKVRLTALALPRQTPTGRIASRSRAYDSMVSMLAGYKLISHLVNGRFSTVIDKSIRKESIEDLLEKPILLVPVQASRE